MTIDRKIAYAPRTNALVAEVAAVPGCVGCKGCKGLCAALIEAMTLPDAVLRKAS